MLPDYVRLLSGIKRQRKKKGYPVRMNTPRIRCASYLLCSGALFTVLFATPPAQAAPNGYTQIPIAKVFGNGVADFSFTTSRFAESSTVLESQYGLWNRFEAGFDYQTAPSDEQILTGNVKYLFAHRPGRLPDVACGIENIAGGRQTDLYVVGTTQPGIIGVSLGLLRPSDSRGIVGMGGIVYNATPKLQLVADVIGGKGNYSTLGVVAEVNENVSVNLAYTNPNGGDNPHGFVLNIAYTFHVLHRPEGKGGDHGTEHPSTTPSGS